MFYDEVRVELVAGKGGDGCMSFRREKYIPKGGPDGGNGGRGGNVVIQADENTGDLRTYHFKPNWKAKTGENGMGQNKHGRSGQDCVLKVPLGTVIMNNLTGEVSAELMKHEEEVVLLVGGKGGRGNTTFKSSINRVPRQFTPGQPGEATEFTFVLKTLADVGLVGFPNAGKSSLTGLLTTVCPRTGAYPFTTLQPSVGMIDYPEYFRRVTMADIPGLIKGASENRGLGHRFLRHIERCQILLLIIDMAGVDGREPWEDYEDLLAELKLYSPEMMKKQFIVAANKMDEASAIENLKEFKKKKAVEVIEISCLLETGVEELQARFYELVFGEKME